MIKSMTRFARYLMVALAFILATPGAIAQDRSSPAPDATRSKLPKATVITLGEGGDKDMVGIYMTEHHLKSILPILEEELGTDGSGIVVFRIKSGGGALIEIQRLSDIIQNEYKKRFRVVAWIDSAISAAAMTAHAIEEIYFTSQGNYGACTGWFGNLQAVKGRELEDVIFMMEKISARGGYDPKIMRSMQIMDPLSATVDANGRVTFYQDEKSGEILVNPAGRILTFNAVTAEKVKFSRGTADTLEELTKAMGFQELDWIGKPEKGILWPVSRAEKWTMDYRNDVKKAEDDFRTAFARINMQIEAAAAAPREERGKFVNRARQTLQTMKRHVENNPNFTLFQFNMVDLKEFKKWYDQTDKQLRDMLR